MMVRIGKAVGIGLLALSASGCPSEPDGQRAPTVASADAAVTDAPDAGAKAAPGHDVDLLELLSSCELRHRGLAIDLGSPLAKPVRNFAVGSSEDVKDVERGGSTYARMLARTSRFSGRAYVR